MANSVVLKGCSHGISVIINDFTDYGEVKANILAKFLEAEGFFKGASVGISFEGVKLPDNYQVDLLSAISEATNLDIVCLIDKDEETVAYYKDIIDAVNSSEPEPEEYYKYATVIRGDISASSSIDTPLGVVVHGNVLKSGKIIAGSDVTIFGDCSGEIEAGYPGNKDAVVFIENYKDCSISIAGITERSPEQNASFFKKKKKKNFCVRVRVKDDLLYFESLTDKKE